MQAELIMLLKGFPEFQVPDLQIGDLIGDRSVQEHHRKVAGDPRVCPHRRHCPATCGLDRPVPVDLVLIARTLS